MKDLLRTGSIALGLVLAGCSGGTGNDAAENGEAGAAAVGSVFKETMIERAGNFVRPQPGLYRSTNEILEFDIPGAPPQVKEMMRNSASSRQAIEYCVTPEEAAKGFEESIRKSQEGDCDYKRFDVDGGRIAAELTCRQDGRTVELTLSGKGNSTSSEMDMTMKTDMGELGAGTIRARSRSERIGECKG